jgi:prepilin-type N-terminal cleavage/methylation domain-containing protein
MRKDQRGFTLIELIMVIVILAILLALALPAYLGTRRRVYLAEANQHLQEMRTHAWLRYVEQGSFAAQTPTPATANWVFAYGTCDGAESCTMTGSGVDGSPVEGASVTLVMHNEGNGDVTSTGF